MTWAVVTDEWGYPQIVDANGHALAFIRSNRMEHAKLMAAAPDLRASAIELLAIVEEERECFHECHSVDGVMPLTSECQPYLDMLDAAIARARAALAKVDA